MAAPFTVPADVHTADIFGGASCDKRFRFPELPATMPMEASDAPTARAAQNRANLAKGNRRQAIENAWFSETAWFRV
jgi:hypothetical protein